MYIFTSFGNQTRSISEIYRDNNVVAYNHVRGCMLYCERKVLDTIGGMDKIYGIGLYEHTDWTNRIHNAGLTTHRVMDIPNSNELIYSMDEHQEAESTFSKIDRIKMIRKNRIIKLKNLNSKAYKEFRQ